jgi:predicted ester cyclase
VLAQNAGMDSEPADLHAFYRRYLERCNEHRFGELAEFVAPDVAVNDVVVGIDAYGDGLASLVAAMPDYHWDLRRLLIDGSWLSARLIDTGTTRAGEAFTLQEFAMYHVADDRIVAAWGDLDPPRLPIER